MKIAIIQADLIWENSVTNRNKFEKKIDEIVEQVDLVILPEMFSTGFTMNPAAVAESMDGDTVSWMQSLAKAKNLAVTGSVVIKDKSQFYNRLLFVFPNGEIKSYDKRHLFNLAGEDKIYSKGKERVLIEYMGWKISPLVCYDLRFPVFSRNIDNYDLLLYIASWPQRRIYAWDALLKARAIENMSYTIGVNRVGIDGNGHQYSGHSQVLDYMGEYILAPEEAEKVFLVELDKEKMLSVREKMGFLNDRDTFTLY